MLNHVMKPAMRVQVELALAKARNDLAALQSLELVARKLGLSGAEVDAAKSGGSFDALVNVAVKFALAVRVADRASIDLGLRRLDAFGVASIASELVALVAARRSPVTASDSE